jgi:hypothetical protein
MFKFSTFEAKCMSDARAESLFLASFQGLARAEDIKKGANDV